VFAILVLGSCSFFFLLGVLFSLRLSLFLLYFSCLNCFTSNNLFFNRLDFFWNLER